MSTSALDNFRSAYLRLRPGVSTLPLSIFVTLIVVTGAAWALTVYQALSMSAPMGMAMRGSMAAEGMAGMAMDGMSAADWSFEGLAVFVALWTVMMVAMMLPAATPMILIFASAQARRDRLVAIPTWIFIAGYFVIWAAAGILVYLVVQAATELRVVLLHSTGPFGRRLPSERRWSSQGYISSRRLSAYVSAIAARR
jgi:predicted metal-binding membrane protein